MAWPLPGDGHCKGPSFEKEGPKIDSDKHDPSYQDFRKGPPPPRIGNHHIDGSGYDTGSLCTFPQVWEQQLRQTYTWHVDTHFPTYALVCWQCATDFQMQPCLHLSRSQLWRPLIADDSCCVETAKAIFGFPINTKLPAAAASLARRGVPMPSAPKLEVNPSPDLSCRSSGFGPQRRHLS